MPWRAEPVDDKTRMVQMWITGNYSKVALADMFGVTRQSVGKWIGRFEELGWEGLEELRQIAPPLLQSRAGSTLQNKVKIRGVTPI